MGEGEDLALTEALEQGEAVGKNEAEAGNTVGLGVPEAHCVALPLREGAREAVLGPVALLVALSAPVGEVFVLGVGVVLGEAVVQRDGAGEALPDSEGVVVTLGVREALPLMMNEPVREGCAVAHDVGEGENDALSVTD